MPEIVTIANTPTWTSTKYFQESIEDQAMYITTCDQNIDFLGMILQASDFDPLNNGKTFEPPIDHESAPVNATDTAAQITEGLRLYKNCKEKFTTYCEFRIIISSIITKKCPEKYMTTLKH